MGSPLGPKYILFSYMAPLKNLERVVPSCSESVLRLLVRVGSELKCPGRVKDGIWVDRLRCLKKTHPRACPIEGFGILIYDPYIPRILST